MRHTGIYLHNNSNKKQIIDAIFKNQFLPSLFFFQGIGLLYADSTIEQIIDEESRHDKYPITTAANNSLRSMSSGEQKKALLQYLINQPAGYIIIDDWNGNIDTGNSAIMQELITAAAKKMQVVQLFYRRQDLLPFIDEVVVMGENNTHTIQTTDEFLNIVDTTNLFNLKDIPTAADSNRLDCDPLIQLKNVTVQYNGRPILQAINWTIRPGEFWQLKGPNGSGKTTLISMLIGDNPKAYGQDIYLFGRKKGSGESVWDIKKNIGYFYPAMTLFFTRNDTVNNMIISGLTDSIGLYQLPTEGQQLIAKAWLQLLGVAYQQKRFNDLTAGQQRIVLVIRAIVKQPPLLILDEPAAGLDEENTNLLIQLINTLAGWKKIAIIYISHRHERQINPDKVFELVADTNGSIGKIMM
jgi:molybdate transport system ATP-binding protein